MLNENHESINPFLYVILFANFVLYSFCLVMASWAGRFSFISFSALWRYAVGFIILGIYAIVWQQILKYIPLTVAYACRSVTVLLGMLWSVVFFADTITMQMGIGATLVICGVVLVAWK